MINTDLHFGVPPCFREWKKALFLIGLMLSSVQVPAAGGVKFPTRVLYQEQGSKGMALILENSATHSYLLQSKVVTTALGNTPAPFMVLPPLGRIEANDRTVLKIQRTGGRLPTDRESLFYLSIRSIPAEEQGQEQTGMVLRLITDYRMKLFYRPASLKTDHGVEQAVGKLTIKRQGTKSLLLSNPTPYYLPVVRINQGNNGLIAAEQGEMVPPFGERVYQMQLPVTDSPVMVRAFDEQGFATKAQQISVR